MLEEEDISRQSNWTISRALVSTCISYAYFSLSPSIYVDEYIVNALLMVIRCCFDGWVGYFSAEVAHFMSPPPLIHPTARRESLVGTVISPLLTTLPLLLPSCPHQNTADQYKPQPIHVQQLDIFNNLQISTISRSSKYCNAKIETTDIIPARGRTWEPGHLIGEH